MTRWFNKYSQIKERVERRQYAKNKKFGEIGKQMLRDAGTLKEEDTQSTQVEGVTDEQTDRRIHE